MSYERWLHLMQAFGFGSNNEIFKALFAAYSEHHRYYHTAQHITAVLQHFDAVIDLFECAREVELALWFHDAVYKPMSATNELDSADWAAEFLLTQGAAPKQVEKVHGLIMATVHSAVCETADESLLIDIDLTILGASEKNYNDFEQAIRREYRLVPYFLYRKKRKEILQGFLTRDRIYQNDYFFDKLESQARLNMDKAVAAL